MNIALNDLLAGPGVRRLAGCPEGLDALAGAAMARARGGEPVMFVARDDKRAAAFAALMEFFADDVALLAFPAWDCLPYDRVSPSPAIVARRLSTLHALAAGSGERDRPTMVITTVNAVIQKTPPRDVIATAGFALNPGAVVDSDELIGWLSANGFSRTGTVVDPGDYAVRGGIIDVFAPHGEQPVRIDFFGDTVESLRTFDARSQRSTGQLGAFTLTPASEVVLNAQTVARFRTGYAARFAGIDSGDPLFEAISAGRAHQGMEHWLALYYDHLDTLFDFLPEGAAMLVDHQFDEARAARLELIGDYCQARQEALNHDTFAAVPYKPMPVESLYLTNDDWAARIAARPLIHITPFETDDLDAVTTVSLAGRYGRSFAPERSQNPGGVFAAVATHVDDLARAGKTVVFAAWSEGSRQRLETILADHGVPALRRVESWAEVEAAASRPAMAVAPLERGFETEAVAVIAEQDILGERLVQRARHQRDASEIISELAAISPGDLVVHVDHGVARFEGLKTIEVSGAPHDCLHLTYHGGDRLFLPVENIELLSRYGSEEAGAQLDRLGGVAWQARRAKARERIREIARELIRTAAERAMKPGEIIARPDGMYDEFCARFPYAETDDQLRAIEAVFDDLASARPMDRLICGDVGFGKTEVALRAALATVMAGKQVAVVVPTTLLARQHFHTFTERFAGYPVNIAQSSRLVGRAAINQTRRDLAAGDIDIVIGTHTLLANDVTFRDLGLLIIDEEQHFGVKHKERLKELKADVHVLTLTATPIPRTLQLAMSGVRELSLIATPPLDRLAVRTFVSPFDPVVVRESLLREHYRGGQSFYVTPRISDLDEIAEFLRQQVPEVRFAVAHGRMAPGRLDQVMSDFYDRKFEVLVSTTIIESGLDIASANTLIVHRADMFGLAQLYQLRGRVGRSKQRAYALLTVPAGRVLSDTAQKRLEVLQSLDSLGAGFSLASHDLDIRGAGNLLGDEQSGHIREVGFELYQSMLEEAVAQLKTGADSGGDDEVWSPQINIGASVLIPESYVDDLKARLALYRRLSRLEEQSQIDAFASELHDRFGPLPDDVRHLLDIVSIKLLCRRANVAGIDAGPKGAVIEFRNQTFAHPDRLIEWITGQGANAKLRPDMKLVLMRRWDQAEDRLKGVRQIMRTLAAL